MYKILEVEDEVKVPAGNMDMDLEEALGRAIEQQYEGTVSDELGIVLAVQNVEEIGEGRMVPGEGAVYYPAQFQLLTYRPQEHEVVIGEVIDITDFGAFIRIGPIDGLVHISQVMNDYVSYDEKNGVLSGRETNKILKKGDVVRARVISISQEGEAKIGLTMRQPHLGALHWMEDDSQEPEAEVVKAEQEEETDGSEDSEEPQTEAPDEPEDQEEETEVNDTEGETVNTEEE